MVESPLKMVIKLVAMVMVGEVLGEAMEMANQEAMELGEGEVLADRTILLPLKVTGILTSATTALRTL